MSTSKTKAIASDIARSAVKAGLFNGSLEGTPAEIAAEYSLADGDIEYARRALGADISEAQSSAETDGLLAVEDAVRAILAQIAAETER